jgi:hypothetical protein
MERRRSLLSVTTVVAIVRRPSLWVSALRQAFRLAPTGWWRRPPFLPLPDERYMRFRLETQYGEAMRNTEPADVVTYLAWCRSYQRELRQRSTRA